MKAKLLYFLFYYAPVSNVGCFRNLRFSKYLERHGFQQYIFTGKFTKNLDHKLNENIPKSAKIYRKKVLMHDIDYMSALNVKPTIMSKIKYLIKDLFFSPDKYIWWALSRLPQMIRVIKKEKIELVMISCPQASLFVVGYLLKRFLKTKLVLDYREPWRDPVYIPVQSIIRRSITKYWETRCVHNADLIISVHDSILDQLRANYNPKARLLRIPNGFDPDDFKHIKHTEKKEGERFTFLYTGRYDLKSLEYNPKQLFTAFERFITTYKIEDCDLIMIGYTDDETLDYVKKLNNPYIKAHGILPKHEVLEIQSRADVLVHFYYPNAYTGIISLKLCEYAILSKPIISFNITEGSVHDFLTNNNLGETANNFDLDAMISLFHKAYQRNIKICDNPSEVLKEYNVEHLSSILAENLFKLIDNNLKE